MLLNTELAPDGDQCAGPNKEVKELNQKAKADQKLIQNVTNEISEIFKKPDQVRERANIVCAVIISVFTWSFAKTNKER